MKRLILLAGIIAIAWVGATALPLAWQAKPAQAATPSVESLMGTALHQEEVEGKFADAIATYRKVLAAPGATRAQKARAQFRIGACFERLGNAEATKAYEAVVSQYGDQSEFAAQARARLTALTGALAHTSARESVAGQAGLALRQIWPTSPEASFYQMSPDGRSVVGVVKRTSDLVVRSLETGNTRILVNMPKDRQSKDWVDEPVWSHDGLRIAYSCWGEETPASVRGEIRIVSIQDGIPKRVPMDKRYELDMPLGWSADGSAVLADLVDLAQDKQGLVAWVSVADGAVRPLVRHGVLQAFVSPDGAWVAYPAGASQGSGVFIIPSGGGEPRPVDVTPQPRKVAGWSPDGRHLLILSAADQGEDLYAVPVADGRPSGEPKPIRRLSTAWSLGISNAGGLLFQSREQPTRQVYRADFDAATGRIGAPSLVSPPTHASSSDAAWSPDGMSIAYVSGPFGRPMRTISIWSVVSGQTRTFTLPFDAVGRPVQWSADGRWIQLAARGGGRTALYRLNVDSGAADPVLPFDSGVVPPVTPGQPSAKLVAWSADGRIVYKSVQYRREGAMGHSALVEHRLSDHAEREIFNGGEGSIIFGVALSPDGRQIALRINEYKPQVVKLVVVPVAGGPVKTVAEWPGVGAASVSWTADGHKLVTPYSTVRADPEERLMCDIESGTITKLAIPLEQVSSMAVSPDGKSIVYVGGPKQKDEGIWLLENFLPKATAKTVTK